MSVLTFGLVFVGELNPYGMDPAFALYHLPRNASGNRLRAHLGIDDVTYDAIPKVNLCVGEWDRARARFAAARVCTLYRTIVCLGNKVRAAFDGPPPFAVEKTLTVTMATLPHPSGMSRAWNDPSARTRARALMRVIAPTIQWGSADAGAMREA